MDKITAVIVLPTYNEKENIGRIIEAILAQQKLLLEVDLHILVVDDSSPDGTADIVELYKKINSNVHILRDQKKDGFGKAYIRGFKYAIKELTADIIFQMDADMSHNPYDIPRFIDEIQKGKDVVIGSRYIKGGAIPLNWTFKRKVNSRMGNMVARFIGGLSGIRDCTGGFRAIKVEAIKKISLNNLEVKGYVFQVALLSALKKSKASITEIPIIFTDRSKGKSKMQLKDQMEFVGYLISRNLRYGSLGMFLFGDSPIHFHEESQNNMQGAGLVHRNKEYITHTTLNHRHTAVRTVNSFQKMILILLAAIFLGSLVINWNTTIIVVFGILITLYFIDLLFNVALIFRSFMAEPEIKITEAAISELKEDSLPFFTVLCPLYKEQTILPQFAKAMSSLDYPKDKLEVLLLFEADDTETIAIAKNLNLPEYIKIVVVPFSMPKTKPKALNYGLSTSSGELIVIYDAEDIPEVDQLKKAVLAFQEAGPKVFCLQAKLNFYNPQQNTLTRLFTAEYSTWFDLVLTGLYSINAPIPLGGTSNFFRKKDIVDVEGWDAFNVCEDCDLGMRLFKRGYSTALFNSTTFEEANSNLPSWIRQRSHWIKGYIQGFFVHLRSPGGFMRSLREPHLITFILVVGGKTLSVFINPLLWIITISYFALRPFTGSFIESLYPAPIFYMGLITLLIGNFLYLYNYMLGCAKRGYWHLIEYAWLIPIYWLLMSFAAWKAVYQIFVKPHYWEKTTHGLHLTKTT